MLVVLGYHAGDKSATIQLLDWIKKLGSVKSHKLLLVVALNTDESGVAERALEIFEKVDVIRPNEDINGWPQGANSLWDCAVRAIHRHPEPWLWMEPDCVPLCDGWIDAIYSEYQIALAAKKSFMGFDVNVSGVERHMSGVAVYPGNTMNYTSKLWELQNIAWDVFLATDFLPYTYFGKTIHHMWWMERNPDTQPTFKDEASLSRLDAGSVLFHRNKDQTLIARLSEKLLRGNGASGEPKTAVVLPAHETSTKTLIIEAGENHENNELVFLRRKIIDLERRISDGPGKTKSRKPAKPKRTPEEQAKINARMAKARASRIVKK